MSGVADIVSKSLKPHLFERWLNSHVRTAHVGEAGSYCRCPIAAYASEITGEVCSVSTGEGLMLFRRVGEVLTLPRWADEFAHLLDSLYANAGADTKETDPPGHKRLRSPDDRVEAREALVVLADVWPATARRLRKAKRRGRGSKRGGR